MKKQWEYNVVNTFTDVETLSDYKGRLSEEKILNKLGTESWELVNSFQVMNTGALVENGTFIRQTFKRPKE